MELKGDSAQQYGDQVSGYFTRRKANPINFGPRMHDRSSEKDRGKQTTKHCLIAGPAVLMPFVAAVGYGISDVVFTVGMAG